MIQQNGNDNHPHLWQAIFILMKYLILQGLRSVRESVRTREGSVVVMALVARFVLFLMLAILVGEKGFGLGDSQQYLALAHSLLDNGTFAINGVPFFYRTIGYPLFLAIGLGIFRSATLFVLFQIIISSFLPLLVLKLGDEFGFSKKVSWIAAVLCALEPHLVFYSATIMTESVYTIVFLLGILYIFRARYERAGIAFGIGMLIKPILQFFPFVLLVVMLPHLKNVILSESNKLQIKKIARNIAVVLATSCLVMLPWMVRNYKQFNSFALSYQGSAAALFYLGTSIVSVRDQVTYQEGEARVVASFKQKYGASYAVTMTGAEQNIAYGKEALVYMTSYPFIFVKLLAINTITLWTSSNYNSFLNYYHLISAIDHSVLPPTHYLAQGRMGDFFASFWKIFAQPFYIVGVIGRVMWTAILGFFLFGLWSAYKKLPAQRFKLLFVFALCVYWTVTIWVDGLGIEARLRYPLLPLELLFAVYGWYTFRKKEIHG